MEEGKQVEGEASAPAPATTAPQAAAAPPVQTEAAPEAVPAPPAEMPAEEKLEIPGIRNILMFGKFDVSGVMVKDVGMARYIDISAVAVPHSGGRHTNKPFAKAKMSVVERLINGMMRTEDFTGKKLKAYRAVENAFGIIAKKTGKNPLQAFVDALQNVAPREEVTRLQYGGISVPKAVDVAPARRVDLALRYICTGSLEQSHKSKKPIEECLADEIIGASNNDMNSFSVSKKEEIERVAASAR